MLKVYGISIVCFATLDMLWVGVIMNPFYKAKIGYLMAPNVSWVPVILFYLLYIGGLVYFVLQPNSGATVMKVVLSAAFFGAIAYGTYDLTSQALIRDWPVTVTVIDIIWGAVASAITAWVVTFFTR